jgi:hypothetical protein
LNYRIKQQYLHEMSNQKNLILLDSHSPIKYINFIIFNGKAHYMNNSPFRISCLLCILLSAAVNPCITQNKKVLPVDDAVRDSTLLAFRDRLLSAAENQDTTFVYSIVDTNVFNGFGGDSGIEIFKIYWRQHGLRKNLIKALKLGGTLTEADKRFSVPYIWDQFPEEVDPFQTAVIIGSNVNVRTLPKLNSDRIAQLSYDIVRVSSWSATHDAGSGLDWIKIDLGDGRTGYICDKYIRSPIAHRFFFEKREGKWILVTWAAGD